MDRRFSFAEGIKMTIREMMISDYDEVYKLWRNTPGMGLNTTDDSREGIAAYLIRNPHTCFVAEAEQEIAGAILAGHDGRRGCFYHVCVDPDYRMRGIGKEMVGFALEALAQEGIGKVNLIAFTDNITGNAFWKELGWTKREDLNYYDYTLNTENSITINK